MKAVEKILSDEQLIRMLLQRQTEEEGIMYLYQHYYVPLGIFVQQHGGNEEDARDIFQEVVVAFMHLVKEQKFRGESTIKTFLFSMNRNMWFNELKRKSRAERREIKYELSKEDDEPSILKAVEGREASSALKDIIGSLGDNCKKILMLYYYESLPMKEILAVLQYENEQVVRNKKYKCLKKLSEMLSGNSSLYQQLKNLLHG